MNYLKSISPSHFTRVLSRGNSLISSSIQKETRKELLGNEIRIIRDNVFRLLGTNSTLLNKISKYYFSKGGKNIRPMLVLLISKATNHGKFDDAHINEPLEKGPAILFKQVDSENADIDIMPSQRRLAEITEMIHTASLLHDDVIDLAMSRRGSPSANEEYGNKMAILAGDFLLARSSIALARLRSLSVMELMATVISNLVEGEFMQLRNTPEGDFEKQPMPSNYSLSGIELSQEFQYYIEKTYLKTASLISMSCQSATCLNNSSEDTKLAARNFGRNLGICFQLVDDNLDFIGKQDDFGKPVGQDLFLGLATAPVLYAMEEHPELKELSIRKFEMPGDVQRANELVMNSKGITKTFDLAKAFCDQAILDLMVLPDCEARSVLIDITKSILTRNK